VLYHDVAVARYCNGISVETKEFLGGSFVDEGGVVAVGCV